MCNSICLTVSAMKPERVLRGLTEFLGRASVAEAGGQAQMISENDGAATLSDTLPLKVSKWPIVLKLITASLKLRTIFA
jgi:hypothetical protein